MAIQNFGIRRGRIGTALSPENFMKKECIFVQNFHLF